MAATRTGCSVLRHTDCYVLGGLAVGGQRGELRPNGGDMRQTTLAGALIEPELQRRVADRQQCQLLGGLSLGGGFCAGNHAISVANGCHTDSTPAIDLAPGD